MRLILSMCCSVLCLSACGGRHLSAAETDRTLRELRAKMAEPVPDRATRDAHSRYLADVVESGALDRLDQSRLRATLGRGRACQTEVCEKAGFGDDDWYWEIGQATSDDVKQLPVLIIGFDQRGIGTRVYNLSTH